VAWGAGGAGTAWALGSGREVWVGRGRGRGRGSSRVLNHICVVTIWCDGIACTHNRRDIQDAECSIAGNANGKWLCNASWSSLRSRLCLGCRAPHVKTPSKCWGSSPIYRYSQSDPLTKEKETRQARKFVSGNPSRSIYGNNPSALHRPDQDCMVCKLSKEPGGP
jgi:hypothetical protein